MIIETRSVFDFKIVNFKEVVPAFKLTLTAFNVLQVFVNLLFAR